ncbi:DUF2063 domain-containing protein [Mucilaginibacter conchicola]|uniref:DUF2063 domain-containing protein n=1 Tax=Mucilaginibacter conchicola TaxID=2303333 RepID=A0A372NQ32_9SPHI|nr:DNA-binding domain-containing protein [Mucilaginibacter conchicola]RFZ91032.1 DUF2063 domain-containing protein [Mucilaginibacter conchicola]
MIKQDTALLQHWLRTIIMAPGQLEHKMAVASRIHQLDEYDVVIENEIAPIQARLNVYSQGYIARLLDCMYADYPACKKFMGDEVFDSFAKAYLMYHPSTSFTLFDLGKAFPEFLERTKPKFDETGDTAYFDIPAELARLERAKQYALRAPGTEDADNNASDIQTYGLLFGNLKVRLPECLQLLEMAFPMKQFFSALHNDEEYEMPSPRKTFMAVSRKNYRVMIDELTEAQYLLLQQCGKHGDFYKAVTAVSAMVDTDQSELLADAMLWMPYFARCAFLVIET